MNDDPRSTTPPRGSMSGAYAWTGGAVLIVLGAIFLLRNVGVIATGVHWWALFILIPAVVMAGTAWTQYQVGGRRFTPAVAGSLTGSVTLAAVAAIFLLDLQWRTIWPVFMIIAGLSALFQRAAWSRRGDRGVGER